MNEALVHRKSIAVAFVTLLQILLPPIAAVSSLMVFANLYDVPFDRRYTVLASLVAVLSLLLLQPPKNPGSQIELRRLPLVFTLLVRWSLLIAILLVIGFATKFSEEFSRRVSFMWAITTPALLIVGALGLHEIMRRLLYDPVLARKVVFAGCNDTSMSLAQRLKDNPGLCMQAVGFFDDRSRERLGVNDDVGLFGRLSELSVFVKAQAIDVIFIALPIRHITRVLDLLDDLRDTTASIYYVPDLFMFDLIQARTGDISGIPVIAMCETPFYGFRGVAKRLFDVVLSFVCLVMLLPLMLGIAFLVKASSPGPVMFTQRSYGLDGHEIRVYKFRTMTVMEDGNHIQQARKGDNRITPVGRFLRQWSLDELPQLINVLQGRMSLVGPRPHAVAHNEQYRKLIKGYMLRHKVLPGITGLAQINGCRGETARLEDMQARINYDLEYLRNWTLFLDLKILILTVFKSNNDRAY